MRQHEGRWGLCEFLLYRWGLVFYPGFYRLCTFEIGLEEERRHVQEGGALTKLKIVNSLKLHVQDSCNKRVVLNVVHWHKHNSDRLTDDTCFT